MIDELQMAMCEAILDCLSIMERIDNSLDTGGHWCGESDIRSTMRALMDVMQKYDDNYSDMTKRTAADVQRYAR